jgi:Lipocalin-like domain
MYRPGIVGLLAGALLGAMSIAGDAMGQPARSDKEQIVGTWLLVSLTAGEGAAQTQPYGAAPKGVMTVDAGGHVSLTVLRADLPKFASGNRTTGTPDEIKAVVLGSISYYGTYEVDDATHVMTIRIIGSTFPNFDGTTQKRTLAFNGDELTFSVPNPSGGGAGAKLLFKRAK